MGRVVPCSTKLAASFDHRPTGPVPADYSIWLNNGQVLLPVLQETGQQSPESPVIWFQSWSFGISLEYVKLMAKGNVLKNQRLPGFQRHN